MQTKAEINVGKKDIAWTYLATFMQIGLGILLYPIILYKLPSETIGIWAIFVTVSSLVSLLDFGFDPSFTRNITYIFSGVNKLEKKGISDDFSSGNINYNLLSSTIRAMKWFYTRISLLVFLLLITIGSIYLYHILSKNFIDNKLSIEIAWVLFCLVNTYNIYTLYYDSLVLGSGKIMRSKQIITISQLAYLIVAVLLLFFNCGLISIVAAQAFSVMIRRGLSYRTFFTSDLKLHLSNSQSDKYKDIVRVVTPNSVKLGLTSIGSFLVLQSSVIIGSFYLSLTDIASYGITSQLLNIVVSLSAVYYSSHVPKIANLRVTNDLVGMKKIYLKSLLVLCLTFLSCGLMIIVFGNWGLTILKSKTLLLTGAMIATMMLIAMLEKIHSIAGGFLLSKNEVPFFKAALISGGATVIMLFLLVKGFSLGLWGMILAPGIVQGAYQNWKWPTVLMKEFRTKNN
ncbi:MAG: O-unit flippase-like protein [Paludibacteraceae bacterium]